ncbi:hypothetical protein [Desulfitobacterium sp. PCE1]|uniref:Uncharacterized protein n=1 Tax=Desulfitobacterium dehalogenans (strain ATCC 51507 / DSM 9161 / JW/IU-DC1) TaxID=756499 RepID=I4A9G0_DESDJ|nr:hypothetical protein [Desulfitobacterium sp. PCE1]AFM00595.1 hypothetical protein Desde_2249 [Desulfitobacterium dehalogenans ATCC 51507]
MEAFFRDDQEIREWIDVFVEKLLTVNLLSGNEADGEFYQGKQAIEKIAAAFQEMFDLPKELLMDGIRQLVEQRLPDHRVIDNFPDFYRLMNDMINAGLQNIETQEPEYFPQQIANLRTLGNQGEGIATPSSKVALNGGGVQTKELDSIFSLREHLLKTMDSAQAMDPIESFDEAPVMDLTQASDYAESNEEKEITDRIVSEDIQTDSSLNEPCPSQINKGVDDIIDEVMNEPLSDPISKSLHELIDESLKQLLLESHSVIDEYTLAYTQSENLNPDTQDELLEETVPALSVLTGMPQEKESEKSNSVLLSRDPFRFNSNKRKDNKVVADSAAKPTAKPAATPQQIPQGGKALAQVLKFLCGDSFIQWNVSVDEYSFLAKVNTLLIQVIPEDSISLDESLIKEITLKMKKQGYKVFTCSHEDLLYPRRLERGIRRIIR